MPLLARTCLSLDIALATLLGLPRPAEPCGACGAHRLMVHAVIGHSRGDVEERRQCGACGHGEIRQRRRHRASRQPRA